MDRVLKLIGIVGGIMMVLSTLMAFIGMATVTNLMSDEEGYYDDRSNYSYATASTRDEDEPPALDTVIISAPVDPSQVVEEPVDTSFQGRIANAWAAVKPFIIGEPKEEGYEMDCKTKNGGKVCQIKRG